MIQLTSVQEAAFNAAGEAMTDLPEIPDLSLTKDGARFRFSATHKSAAYVYVFGYGDTPAVAFQQLAEKLAVEDAKPPVLNKPVEVRDAAAKIVEEVRNAPELNPLALDEIADRIARLPVKE